MEIWLVRLDFVSTSSKAEEMLRLSCWGQYDVIWGRCGSWTRTPLGLIWMPLWDGLTWFLCGGVDGRWLWPGASRVESSHREVVHCVRFQPRDVHQRVVSRYAHFANSVRLGVIFPVHDLLGRKKKKTNHNRGHKQAGFWWCISLHYWNSYSIMNAEIWNAVCITKEEGGREGESDDE